MPREWDATLQSIFQSYKRRDSLDVYLNNNTVLKMSRGSMAGYNNWIRSISDLSGSIDQAVDRMTVVCQNVSSDLGFNLASNLRLLDYALADYGKEYESLRTPGTKETIPQMFRGVLANAQTDEQNFTFEMIVDYESLGSVIASRGCGPRCPATYKNGIECTSTNDATGCPKTRGACFKRGVEFEFMGWEFFETVTASTPGSGGDPGGGIGSGRCFTLPTKVWLPSGEVPIGDLPVGRPSERIPLVSFDKMTGEIDYDDEIVEVFEHDSAQGYFTFESEHGELEPTPEHNIWLGFNRFRAADQFALGNTLKVYTDRWAKSPIKSIRWNSDARVKVRNLHGKKNNTYFANRIAVSNSKLNPDEPPIY